MARQARIQYPGALHHVRARGNRGDPIFASDRDRVHFLELLGEAVRRFGWRIYAYVLMRNHVHLAVETPQPNLSEGMRWLLGVYGSWFNRQHGLGGHLFGDRFHSDLVEKESYLLELVRYIVLNPVRVRKGGVKRPERHRWSSYKATAGLEKAPKWLALEALAPHFGEPETWQANYCAYVDERIDSSERLWDRLVHGIYLGGETWLTEVRKVVESKLRTDVHPRAHRSVGRPPMARVIEAVARAFGTTHEAIRHSHGGDARRIAAWLGWYEGWQSLRAIAASLRIRSSGRASDLVGECEELLSGNAAMQQRIDLALAALA